MISSPFLRTISALMLVSPLCGQVVKLESKSTTKQGVVYSYKLTNTGQYPILKVFIGFNQGSNSFELVRLPVGCTFKKPRNRSISAPKGWQGIVEFEEESNFHAISFSTEKQKFEIPAGGNIRGLKVMLNADDPSYEQCHWVVFRNGASKVSGQVQHQ